MNIFNNFSLIFESNKLIQTEFRKGRGIRDQIANIHWIIERAREFQKNNYFCFTDQAISLCKSQKTVENSSKDGNTRPPYLPPEKSVCQGCLWSPCLFNLHAEYIMQNAGLDEAQAESRFPGKISVNSDKQITPPLRQKVKKN